MSIYTDAISAYGEDAQLLQVAEECAELSKEIIKDVKLRMAGYKTRPEKIIEEWADVEVTLNYLKIIYTDLIDKKNTIKTKKLKRLRERLIQTEYWGKMFEAKAVHPAEMIAGEGH
jgi:hypothetical protein